MTHPDLPGDLSSLNLSFAGEDFSSLSQLSRLDLRVGAAFSDVTAKQVATALRDARRTITTMPMKFTTLPGSDKPVFKRPNRLPSVRTAKGRVRLDADFLSTFGEVEIPAHLWSAMARYACWLEPAVVSEWARLIASYETTAAKKAEEEGRTCPAPLPIGDYLARLEWADPVRTTAEVRDVAQKLAAEGQRVYCVWTGKDITRYLDDGGDGAKVHIDHCLPVAHWPNDDLWNLLPSWWKANNSKSEKLPTPELLARSEDRILDWWDRAHGPETGRAARFADEAGAALPRAAQVGGDVYSRIYEGLSVQPMRLRHDQQIAEWEPMW